MHEEYVKIRLPDGRIAARFPDGSTRVLVAALGLSQPPKPPQPPKEPPKENAMNDPNNERPDWKNIGKIAALVIVLLAVLVTFRFTVIDETQRGIVLHFGHYTETYEPGLHIYNGITTSVVKIQVSTQLEETSIEAGSRDLQQVNVATNVNYHPLASKVGDIYSRFGCSYVETILQPKIKETITGVTAQYVPEEMLQKREEIRSRMERELRAKLDSAGANIVIAGLTITSFNFSNSFNAAIEAKQVAEQEALREKNVLEKIKYQNEQRVAKAKADSATITLQMNALKKQSGKDYLMLKWIEKWNGQLPSVVADEKMLPVVNLK